MKLGFKNKKCLKSKEFLDLLNPFKNNIEESFDTTKISTDLERGLNSKRAEF